MSKDIATAYVRFVQVPGGKRRPIYILQEDKERIYFWNITTKFENKSKRIKKNYFEIQEYEYTGLKRHSWIDTNNRYSIAKDSIRIKYIGNLSNNDTQRLADFLKRKK
ncbi:MAG: toxin MazF [Bacteroides sp.]|nr:toxin MazF [Bacteroides sp.]